METWGELAAAQAGALSHRQLAELKVSRATVRNKLVSGRWQRRTEEVLTTTTGPMSAEQHHWVAVLHCGPDALLGGLTAAGLHGLKNWHREEVHVLVGNDHSFEPLSGVTTFRTRRSLAGMRHPSPLPTCALEPAVLLWAGTSLIRDRRWGCWQPSSNSASPLQPGSRRGSRHSNPSDAHQRFETS
jgi:hypothetical protein